ncbi:hypothetical protein TrispH2_011318 [Trichoplax sp. H2]|nr:hypothetical protein TrispH2_011318 [Trichoplax sp. H2]|eukprot:RDD37894.1 hypothetical protein TrispH2_011318 [Trichoplax sp. H2]
MSYCIVAICPDKFSYLPNIANFDMKDLNLEVIPNLRFDIYLKKNMLGRRADLAPQTKIVVLKDEGCSNSQISQRLDFTAVPNVDRFKTAPQISVALREEYGLNVSVTTNSRRLRKVGLYGRRP